MRKRTQVGVFIAGRLGSERLPNKLILPLGDSCLWEIACRKLNALPKVFNKYALCTEPELIAIAEKYPNIQVIKRDPRTAQVDEPLKYIFKDLEGVMDTHLMFLNPCLAELSVETIEQNLFLFEDLARNAGVDYATSAKEYKNWAFDGAGNNVTPIDYTGLSTKSIPLHYECAHCFHIFNVKNFFEDGHMLKAGHALLTVPKEELMDVDTPQDYEFAKWKLSKKYVIDIDGTICTHEADLNYNNAKPLEDRIAYFNHLYNAGNRIVYQTARGYTSHIDWTEATKAQLNSWGVRYHELICSGKPSADYYIDDKAINVNDIFGG